MMHKSETKRWHKTVVFFIVGLLVLALLGLGGIYYILFKDKEKVSENNSSKTLVNPAEGLSVEKALTEFDKDFVYFLLYSIKAYNLHEAPFSNELPIIEIVVEDGSYYGKVKDGRISVSEGKVEDEDIVIYSSKEEIVKMMKNRNYVKTSFESGLSSIELVSDKLELYSKGYLDIYDELK